MKNILLCICLLIACLPARSQTLALDSTTLDITIAVDSTKLIAPFDIEWGFDNKLWITDAKTIKRWDPATGNIKTMYRMNRGYGLGLAVPKTMPLSGPAYVYAVFDTSYYYANSAQLKLYRLEYNVAADTLLHPMALVTVPHFGEHSGGKVAIGTDGKVLLTTPEYEFVNDTLNAMRGRVLRMNADGSAAAGNMRPDRTYSIGHRNSQGIVVLPDGKILATEHSGPSEYDEVNLITPGGHYGWPALEGMDHCTGLGPDSCASATYAASHKKPIYMGMMTPAGLDYYDHPAIPEWRNCLLVGTLYAPDTCLAVLKMNLTHDTVYSRRNYLKKNTGGINDLKRTRDICVAKDGSIYCIVRDRLLNIIGDSLINQGCSIVKLKNNAYVPPPVSLGNVEGEGTLVYPVPADGHIDMSIADERLLGESYRVTDIYGRQMVAGKINERQMRMETNAWPAGNYALIINTANGSIMRKLVVVH
ncbi:hypothetical protein GCM10023093_28780 [Nemorincola caseinilytica]|uniref:T9SS type A sorting domain-containing protein n=1 Tax=Nemorincola caseinilytica TaxID=2054315 RepID=A0ABP8NQZ0_9BACT